MSPTRRQVVCAVGTGAVLPTTVATASARQDDDQDDDGEFSPEITFNSNNLVATIGEREGGVDPDEVTIQTADGSTHTFDGSAGNESKVGNAFEVGYTNRNQQDTRARIENWHGIVVKVTATRGDRTVSATNDNESSLGVSCSLWKTPDEPPTEFTAISEGASKQHVNRGDQDLSADQRQYGSPGRALWTVVEENPETAMWVDFLECDPDAEKALWFDCTSVTVTKDELNQGGDRIEDVQLTFNDGSTERPPGTADEADNGAYELPVTLSGSGDNEGKVLKKLKFRVERGRYTYWNLETEGCSAEGDDGGDGSGGGESTPESGEETPDSGDGSSGSDGGSGSEETATETPSEQGPSSDETGSTATPEPTDDGSGSGSGGGGSGGSGGSSGGSGGASDDVYRDSAQDTETSRTAEVGDGNGDASRRTRADDAGNATASPSSANGSAGAGNGTESGGAQPVTTEGVTSEDQPGMGVVSALGGLLGLGELARRRLGQDGGEPPETAELPGDAEDER